MGQGSPFRERMTPTGICALGDSNTHQSYLGLPTQCQGCNGVADNYSSRWTQKLALATGWRVINRGDNGRQVEDYLGRGSGVFSYANWEAPQWWLMTRAKYYLCCFGLNETGLTLPQFRADIDEICDVILRFGGIPILMTNVAVYYNADLGVSWYNTDRNPTIDAYDDQMRDVAATRSLLLADANASFKADIALGNYDHRIRADGTLDASNDAAHTGNPQWADYHTNIHLNALGSDIVSATLEDLIIDEGLTPT